MKTIFGQEKSAGSASLLSSAGLQFLFWAVLLLALLPWAYLRSQQATHSDILWLTEALQRILAGSSMSEMAFETNPPLSMLVYILPVLCKSFFNIPLHYAVVGQTFLLSALSTLAVYKILKAWKLFPLADVNIICAGFLLAVTLFPSIYFGERDHLLALGLVPFILIQASITLNLPRPKGWSIPVLALGAVLILLKPHHGLLPTLLLAHRAITQRRLSIVRDPDFLCLAIAVLSYLTLIFLAFPDYAFIVFPDVMTLYLKIGSFNNIFGGVALFILPAIALFLLPLVLKMPLRQNYMVMFLVMCGLVGLIPFVVQKMGFFYHLVPTAAFFFMAIALVFFYFLKMEIKNTQICLFLSIPCLLFLAFIAAPRDIPYPDHDFFKETPFAKLISNCPDQTECSFFLFNKDMGIMHETAYYTGIPHISRFPSLWFLPAMMRTQKNMDEGETGPLGKEDFQTYFTRYAAMMAEDIERHKPFNLVIWDWGNFGPGVDFMEYFKQDERFKAAIAPYRKTDTLEMDYTDYYLSYKANKGQPSKASYRLYERNLSSSNMPLKPRH